MLTLHAAFTQRDRTRYSNYSDKKKRLFRPTQEYKNDKQNVRSAPHSLADQSSQAGPLCDKTQPAKTLQSVKR